MERIGARVRKTSWRAKLGVADLSRWRGGQASPWHSSHESGRDVDLLFYSVGEDGKPLPPPEHEMICYGDDGKAYVWRPRQGRVRGRALGVAHVRRPAQLADGRDAAHRPDDPGAVDVRVPRPREPAASVCPPQEATALADRVRPRGDAPAGGLAAPTTITFTCGCSALGKTGSAAASIAARSGSTRRRRSSTQGPSAMTRWPGGT